MIDQSIFSRTEEKMKKSIEAVQREFGGIRAGRATPALLDKIQVECYGANMPIKQVANVSIPEARMIIIQPWDKTLISNIEKAVQKSDLGINPANDGNVIRLVVPALTEERRQELTKVVKKKVEEGKVSVRNIRRDAIEEIKAKEKESSEDEVKRAQEQIQKMTDKYIAELDRISAAKEKEIMEV